MIKPALGAPRGESEAHNLQELPLVIRKRDGFLILAVETDNDFLLSVREGVRQHARIHCQIDQAHDFDEAIRKLRDTTYDLVLVENRIQDREGVELVQEVNKLHLDLPFILMTDIRDDTMARRALSEGVADVIIKSESQYQDLVQKLEDTCLRFSAQNQKKISRRLNSLADGKKDEPSGAFVALKPRPDASETAHRDELTGLYNHAFLHERIVGEFSTACRYEYPISCLMIDIDHFHLINEERGHLAGDQLLKECARMLFDSCRMSDLVSREGGEEFVVLLPHSDYKSAGELADRLRHRFSEHVFLKDSDAPVNLTISIGISSYPEDPMMRRCELLTFATQALYRAKVLGRNKVTRYREVTPSVGGASMPELKLSEEKVAQFQRRMTEISDMARRECMDASKDLLHALESKDRFSTGHGMTAARYSALVAEKLGMSLDETEAVQFAAMLHDIGKICIPDHILLKTEKLSFSEYEAMKQHPYLGYKILKPIKFLQEEAVFVLHHHEWFNGEGYPCRLRGSEIPLGARVIAVVEAYDAMRIAGGRYKRCLTVEGAVGELIKCAGTQFDPRVVKAFAEVLVARKELAPASYDAARLETLIRDSKTS